MHVAKRVLQADCTSDNKHDDEDDWETPEGDGNRIESKVLHIVQLLNAPHVNLLSMNQLAHVPVHLFICPYTHSPKK